MRRFLLAILLALFAIILLGFLANSSKMEGFGTSPGTMVQLQTSHVPTEEDYNFYTKEYPKMVRREVADLTGGDPGELRPWIFPWYGRGVTLIN
jgi:hypothetical protein